MVSKITIFSLGQNHTNREHLQEVAEELGACRSFQEIMRQALIPGKKETSAACDSTQSSIFELPSFCSLSAGGEANIATPITWAWGLLYTAAHTMDKVVDQDEPSSWWAHLGPAVAINTATGLYASSGHILMELFQLNYPYNAVIDIMREFHSTILRMCSGQHDEISKKELSLDDYWHIAEAKSGSFFALGCYAGARVATDDEFYISSFREFGNYLGMIIQISDDTKDFWVSSEQLQIHYKNLLNTLPVIYTLSVASYEKCNQLIDALHKAPNNPFALSDARDIVENAGAALYVMTKVEQYRQQAQQALENVNSDSPAHEKLMNILNYVGLKAGQ